MSVAHEERTIAVTVPKDKSEVISSFIPADFDVPTGREEEWRFTPLRRMKPLLTALPQNDGATVEIDGDPAVIGVDAAQGPIQPGEWLVPVDVVSALAWAGAADTTLITIPPKTDLENPVTVTITGTSTSYQKLRVTIEHDSSATVVINHQGTGQHAENIEVEVGARSQLKLVVIQGLGSRCGPPRQDP